MVIPVQLGANSYDIIVDRGCISNATALLNLNRKVLVVTDSGVPAEYAKSIAKQCKSAVTVTVPQGEGSKGLETYAALLEKLLVEGFTRTDCVVAVGGGVVGDLAGFAAASYMRGIDFYNIPTTVLSQIDSSIGGKTAINFGGVKNIVGAFYQPKRVLIDPNMLDTLPPRQWSNGMAEAVKMALTSNAALFELFETEDIRQNVDNIIISCLNIKKDIVEKDEKESGLRRMLNFGHTIGHGIETASEGKLYHGECVALGMLPMCGGGLKGRLTAVLKKLNLPTAAAVDADNACAAMLHDKKFAGGNVTVVKVNTPGEGFFQSITAAQLTDIAAAFIKEGARA